MKLDAASIIIMLIAIAGGALLAAFHINPRYIAVLCLTMSGPYFYETRDDQGARVFAGWFFWLLITGLLAGAGYWLATLVMPNV